MNLVLVSIGGGLGAVCRYLMGILLQEKFPSTVIPTAMLSVNLLGSFGLGLFLGFFYGSIPAQPIQDPIYLLFGVGFFGAFTTFSTFSVEAVQLLREHSYTRALVYISLTIAGSVFIFLLGLWIGSS
ncbi:fluoride efflux transporter CrcB [Jeotgalibacillus sp. ET6]|uniref:fluoride efflux transporter CrcB n=1 Tax=Jeotgalibacillus sp. ET6 TaxID=3037260 RepID=UPI002418237F|nr:fluoride efflux transporter CrcB [Jeotgalibacillus sp. ET6]MDG5471980.1 fluoride efflux transporter CrcB [Jeotgalibacillus sp. ET6]